MTCHRSNACRRGAGNPGPGGLATVTEWAGTRPAPCRRADAPSSHDPHRLVDRHPDGRHARAGLHQLRRARRNDRPGPGWRTSIDIFADPIWISSIWHTLVYTFFTVPVAMAIAVVIAVC